MANSTILHWNTEVPIDEDIESYQYHEYPPDKGATQLNTPGEIRLTIESQDVFTHTSKSYLYVVGRLISTAEVAAGSFLFQNTDNVALVNNGIMNLFSQIKFSLSGQEVENILYPGQTSTMLGMLKYPDDFNKSRGLNQCWFKDYEDGTAGLLNVGFETRRKLLLGGTTPGNFSFLIPVSHIFGFFEDYNKILYGVKQEISLIRKGDGEAIHISGGDRQVGGVDKAYGTGMVEIVKLSWFVPHVLPADEARFALYKQIDSKITTKIGFKSRQCESIIVPQAREFVWRLAVKSASERPRFLVLGFQTGNKDLQTQNSAIFNHLNLTNVHVYLNTERYPEIDYNINFNVNEYARAYFETSNFRYMTKHLPMENSNFSINSIDFKTLYPLFVFDLTKQKSRLRASVVDIQVRAKFGENVPADTKAYAVVLSDKIFNLQSDGKKMNPVF